jgi:hypothetical protein
MTEPHVIRVAIPQDHLPKLKEYTAGKRTKPVVFAMRHFVGQAAAVASGMTSTARNAYAATMVIPPCLRAALIALHGRQGWADATLGAVWAKLEPLIF